MQVGVVARPVGRWQGTRLAEMRLGILRCSYRDPMAIHAALVGAHHQREIDPSVIVTHGLWLDEASLGCEVFKNKEVHCIKIVLKMSSAVCHSARQPCAHY